MARAYDVDAVERKWQRHWDDEGTYQIDNDDPREKFYVLCMYPYPSGPAHQGHVRNYTFGDLTVRYQTMQGKAVLSARSGSTPSACRPRTPPSRPGPIPRIFTEARIAELKASLTAARGRLRLAPRGPQPRPRRTSSGTRSSSCGSGRPGLAYRALAPVNWCPGCQTVLANEQVLPDGTCERSGDLVDQARPRAVVLPHHRVRRRAARRPRRPRVARAGQDHAAQLDRAVRGRRVRPRRRGPPRPDACGSSPPGPTPASA